MNLFERMEKQGDERRQFQTAKKMLQKNFSWDLILELTGLSKEKFQELAAKLENQVKST